MAQYTRPLPPYAQRLLRPTQPVPTARPAVHQAPATLAVPDPGFPGNLWPDAMMPSLREKVIFTGPCLFRQVSVPRQHEQKMKVQWMAKKRDFLERGWAVVQIAGQWEYQQYVQRGPDGNLYLTPKGQSKLDDHNRAVPFEGRESEPVKKKERTYIVDEPKPLPTGLSHWDRKILELGQEDDFSDFYENLPTLPWGLDAKLLDYQITPARQLLRALTCGQDEWGYPGAWDCSQTGTGKTFQALAAALATGREVCVLCPLSVIGTFPTFGRKGSGWKGAFAHFGQHAKFIMNYEALKTGRREWVAKHAKMGARGKKIVWFEWNEKLLKRDDVIFILDESHVCKAEDSLNSGLARALIRQKYHVIFVSATLAQNPSHMKASGLAVGLYSGRTGLTWDMFKQDYGIDQDGKFIGGPAGRYHMTRINKIWFPRRGGRTRISDLGDRFPETQIIAEAFETGETKAIQDAYKKAEMEIEEMERAGSLREQQGFMARAAIWMKAFQAGERLKVPSLVAKVQDEVEAGHSVALFVNFSDVREELGRRLRTTCMIHGGQTPDARNRCIADFQADKARVIICQIAAGGVGVSLHDENGDYPRLAIIMPNPNAVLMKQALGRVHRAGGKSRSRQIIFFAAGTLEEKVCDSVRDKVGNIDSLTDGDLHPPKVF